jgi:hypothetical protein
MPFTQPCPDICAHREDELPKSIDTRKRNNALKITHIHLAVSELEISIDDESQDERGSYVIAVRNP